MSIEMLVGLNVIDDEIYQKYREHMFPILQSYNGGFGYDFKVSEVLKSESKKPINRVFTIFFNSQETMDAFFADEKYMEIKNKYFEYSVADSTIISKYEK